MMTMECVSSAVSTPGDNIQLLHTAQSAEKGKQADTIHILQYLFFPIFFSWKHHKNLNYELMLPFLGPLCTALHCTGHWNFFFLVV